MIDFREKIIKLSLNFHISPQTYERIEQKWSATCKKEYLARTVTTATNNNMNTNPNEESRANTMKDANDEVEKMKNILIKINEGKEAHVNGETTNADKKEEKLDVDKSSDFYKKYNKDLESKKIITTFLKNDVNDIKITLEKNKVTLLSEGNINLVDAELNELLLSYKSMYNNKLKVVICENCKEYDY